MKVCKMCHVEFEITAPAQLYCCSCKLIRDEQLRLKRKEYAEKKRREKGCKIGRGASRGEAHPNYKHGKYVAQTQAPELHTNIQYCERCGKDLLGVSSAEWVMHHKDHNHCNHEVSNLELLCKRCHQLEHKCWENFTGTCNDYPERE